MDNTTQTCEDCEHTFDPQRNPDTCPHCGEGWAC